MPIAPPPAPVSILTLPCLNTPCLLLSRIDLSTGELTTLSRHTAPVRCVAYSPAHALLVSASWDQTLHVHSTSPAAPRAPLSIALPGKPHALGASPTKLVVAMTARLVHIFDLPTLAAALLATPASTSTDPVPAPAPAQQPWQQRESSLKFLTRAVACMPTDAGYATSSIEGRVAVEWFEDTGDVVYPVNALAFHPMHGTFASGGGDGHVALWDATAKRRLRQFQRFPDSVAAVAFSNDGKYLAMGVCPGFETGMEDYSGEGSTRLFVRELGESEAKGKGGK